ncbi:MAG TPA: anti-sigma factor [Ferruginibacter sp.]|nr:anti-sigma factor [Ferruginibacter sp.]
MKAEEIISSGILETYVLGLATPQQMAEVEAWAQEYPQVKAELNAIEERMQQYAFEHAIAPSTSVKEKLLQQVNQQKEKEPVPVKPVYSIWKYIAAASVVLLLGSIYFNWTYYNQLKKSENELTQSKEALAKANNKLNSMNDDMAVVKNKYSRTVSLDGLEASPDAAAKVFWMKNSGEVFVDASNLPAAPQGMQYQFWGIVDGKPVDGGMLVTSKTGSEYRIQKMKSFGKAEAFAITLEKEGGNPTPQGKMYVMGKL